MIGKASEIKIQHINVKDSGFQASFRSWMVGHPDVELIDIKFTATALPGEEDICHALIIYKEAV